MRDNFLQNLKTIEKALYESKTFEFASKAGIEGGVLAQICTEIFKQALQGAVQMEDLKIKSKESVLNLDKTRIDMELSILNAKAQIKVAYAEVLKSLIQAKSMVRSVSDNALINKANAYVGYLNVVANATASGQDKNNVIDTISAIDVSKIEDFNDLIKNMIDLGDDFGCVGSKNVILHAPKTLLALGEIVEFKAISTFGENDTRWTINDELVASKTKNYIFEAANLGEYKIAFAVKNNKDEYVKDEVMIKVIESELNKTKPYLKKF